MNDDLHISVDIENCAAVDGDEVVQVYIRDLLGSVTPVTRMLRKFQRVHIQAGKSETVSFTLTSEDFSILDRHLRQIIELGEFEIQIGASSEDIKLKAIIEITR
jgi:beta-glucosidase